eukprot:tig00000402_g248.t1
MSEAVRVAVRVRPFNQREKDRNSKVIIEMEGVQTSIVNPETNEPKHFAFDFSYWSHDGFVNDETGYSVAVSPKYASQRKVFDDLGTSVLDNAWNGYNCSLFAYGQTGAGKSYSMVGYGTNKGIIPITCETMFERITANPDPAKSFQMTVSMLEIYNEKVRDLLNPKNNPPGGLKVKQDKRGVYVEDLAAIPCTSYKEVERQMDEGTTNRTIGSTQMNATSSRAHTVFTITFTIVTNTPLGKSETSSKINLIDLAGSERAESTGATGDRLKEGCAINQSLSALGNVISALADASTGKKGVFVPYRNSVLTRLLQDALGGNSKTIMICALSPADINYEETLSTLRYADRAKKIKNAAIKNENPTEKLIRELKEENDRLKKALETGGIAIGAGGGADPAEVERLKKEFEDQMRQNEALLAEKQKSWEQRMSEAAAFVTAQAGISEDDKKVTPLLTNLNEDLLLSEKIVYLIKPGETTRAGKKNTSPPPQIGLAGLNIQAEHCEFTNADGVVTLVPKAGAKTFVNGKQATSPTQLSHNDRIIFGMNHFYRFQMPTGDPSFDFTWEFAQKEFVEAQGLGMSLGAASGKMDEEEAQRRKEFEEKMRQLEEEAAKRKKELESLGVSGHDDLKKLLEAKEKELEEKAKALQMIEEQAGKRKRDMALMEDSLNRIIPEVNECNMIAQELKKGVTFEVKLVDTIGEASVGISSISSTKMEMRVRVEQVATKTVWLWDIEKFENRIHLIRDVYQNFLEQGPVLLPKAEDPFWDPPEDTVIGRCQVFLQPLAYILDVDDWYHVVDYSGAKKGMLKVQLFVVDAEGRKLAEQEDAAEIDDPIQLIGKSMHLMVNIESAKEFVGINDPFVEFRFYLEREAFRTKAIPGKSTGQQLDFHYSKTFAIPTVTPDFINYLKNDHITLQVYGHGDEVEPTPMGGPGAKLGAPRAPRSEVDSVKKEKEQMEDFYRKQMDVLKKEKEMADAARKTMMDEVQAMKSFDAGKVPAAEDMAKLKREASMQRAELDKAKSGAEVEQAAIALARAEQDLKKAELEAASAETAAKKAAMEQAKAEMEVKKATLELAKPGSDKEAAEAAKAEAEKRKGVAAEAKAAAEKTRDAAQAMRAAAAEAKAAAEKAHEEAKARAAK